MLNIQKEKKIKEEFESGCILQLSIIKYFKSLTLFLGQAYEKAYWLL